MSNKSGSKKKIIAGIVAAALAITGFGFGVNYFESRGLEDEQLGDTGDWGEEEQYEQYLSIGDKDFITTDNLDTYLMIGTDDGGQDLGEAYSGEFADFLVLLIVDNTTKKYAFMQIDRNTMTNVDISDEKGNFDSTSEQQICIAHWYGLTAEDRNENTVKAVSELFGDLKIDNYYTLHMKDIAAVNHAIGGVVVDIDEDLTSVDPAFEKGASVLLDDKQAEKFVRARKNAGDGTNKGRMSRQTQYMQKAYNLVMSQLRDNPEYINELYAELKDTIQSGSHASDISVMANQILQYESCGILQFDGKTRVADTHDDGIELEEFYMDKDSMVKNLSKVMNLKEDTGD